MYENEPQKFYSTNGIVRHCSNHTHFFDKGSMRWFNSRLSQTVIGTKNPYIWLFITSEKFDDWHNNQHDPRKYTIRKYDSRTKDVGTLGEFQAYNRRDTAILAAMRLGNEMEFSIDDQHDLGLWMNEEFDRDFRKKMMQYPKPIGALHKAQYDYAMKYLNCSNEEMAQKELYVNDSRIETA